MLAALVATWIAHPGLAHDGDTFPARIELWQTLAGASDPNKMMTLPTNVRVMGIDTPELDRPRCEAEKALAIKARDFTTAWLASSGVVYLQHPKPDAYAGRTDAIVLDPNGAFLADALIASGLAWPMSGATRTHDWCAGVTP